MTEQRTASTPDLLNAVAVGLATEMFFGANDLSVIRGLTEDLPDEPGVARQLITLMAIYLDNARLVGPEALAVAGLAIARREYKATP